MFQLLLQFNALIVSGVNVIRLKFSDLFLDDEKNFSQTCSNASVLRITIIAFFLKFFLFLLMICVCEDDVY
jgi:hypothetical protein